MKHSGYRTQPKRDLIQFAIFGKEHPKSISILSVEVHGIVLLKKDSTVDKKLHTAEP